MIKQLLRELDFSFFAEVSLLLFVAVFVVVSLITLFRSQNDMMQQAHIVLDDNLLDTKTRTEENNEVNG